MPMQAAVMSGVVRSLDRLNGLSGGERGSLESGRKNTRKGIKVQLKGAY